LHQFKVIFAIRTAGALPNLEIGVFKYIISF
jgi:hypothetical protein